MPLDIGVGILLSLFILHTFAAALTPQLLLLSIIAALLPDIDIVTKVWGQWQHRKLTHYPAVYLPLVLIVYLLFGTSYATLLFLGVFLHLVHDTVGIGWGVSWLWPFTKRRFLFFPEKGRRKRYGWFMSWLPENQKNIIEDQAEHNWVVAYYLRPSVLGAIEYGFLLVSILFLFFYTR
jgi:hypothetical protein